MLRNYSLLAAAIVGWQSPGQQHPAFELPGTLELVDKPPFATPVEAFSVGLHLKQHGDVTRAQPDKEGRFILRDVTPGLYSLNLSFPGRIRAFTAGGKDLDPADFRLDPTDRELRVVVTLKTAALSIAVNGFPSGGTGVVALLAPADRYLTLRESCTLNSLTGPQTTFRYVPPGKYRIFIVDSSLQRDVGAYAPRFPDFLENSATAIEVAEDGETKAVATYLSEDLIREAIRRAGPIR